MIHYALSFIRQILLYYIEEISKLTHFFLAIFQQILLLYHFLTIHIFISTKTTYTYSTSKKYNIENLTFINILNFTKCKCFVMFFSLNFIIISGYECRISIQMKEYRKWSKTHLCKKIHAINRKNKKK